MAKHLARIIFYGVQSVGRAFAKAIRQEIEISQELARQREGFTEFKTQPDRMSLTEAMLILNVKNLDSIDEIESKYEHLFQVNDKANGGSLYIQSKVFRAKERIDWEMKNQEPKQNIEAI